MTANSSEQRELMARPWEAAEPESIWEITGQRPDGSKFERCLAMTASGFVTGTDEPLFVMISAALQDPGRGILPAWITRAVPLLLVHRDEPRRAYHGEDQEQHAQALRRGL